MKTASKAVPEGLSNETEQTTIVPASPPVTGAVAATRKKAVTKPQAARPAKSGKGNRSRQEHREQGLR